MKDGRNFEGRKEMKREGFDGEKQKDEKHSSNKSIKPIFPL